MIEQKIDEDDPRSQSEDDNGPLGNKCNICLKSAGRTGWDDGYKDALVNKAIPFLQEGGASLLIVAAGFDAMDTARTSQLNLKPEDYENVGKAIYDSFGKRVAFGLEGGYSVEDGGLSRANLSFVKPWQ
jgi:acetoin utilization deacetylase AcuC-like enzyme